MKNWILVYLCICSMNAFAIDANLLESSNKGWLYAYWGYNRALYSKSDIHFISPNYNITFNQLSASDRPSSLSLDNYVSPKNILVPQYNFRFGYFLTSNLHISAGMDHMKYIIDQGQKTTAIGYVDPNFYAAFGGNHNGDTFQVGGDDFSFEHTNGLNLASIDIDYLQPLFPLAKRWLWFKWNIGVGGVFVITKTDLRIFNEGIDNQFHLSGLTGFVKTGPRIEFLKYLAFGFEGKAGYMNLPSILIHNDEPKHAEHRFYFFEYYGYLALQIPLNKFVQRKKIH